MRNAQTPQYQLRGSGPVLIYIAGLDGTGELFFKQSPGLEQSYRVVTYRSRGGYAFNYADLTADIASIIKELGEPGATILGESFGGTVALSFALAYPRMVERLVVINSFPRFRGRIRIRLAAFLSRVLPFQLLKPFRIAASLLGLHVDRVDAQARKRFFEAIGSVDGQSYSRRLELIGGLDLENRLAEIQIPTLFIAGARDLLIPSSREARQMAERMPNARVTVVAKAGHACLLGDRVRLAEILAEWMEH